MNVILYFEAMDVVVVVIHIHSLESSECLKCGMDGI